MSTVSETERWPGQRKPTTGELSAFLELLGQAEGYPRSARDGGRLRRVG